MRSGLAPFLFVAVFLVSPSRATSATAAQLPTASAGGTPSSGALSTQLVPGCTSQWVPAFGPESGVNASALTFAQFDDGTGPALYAGGDFTSAGAQNANHVAKWNGTSWSTLGSGVEGGSAPTVRALAVFDDGGGPKLYAGGDFTLAGGAAASNIAKWDGASWSPLGSGVNSRVAALCVYDDGGGPALYAGGLFTTAGGASARGVARWNGTTWTPLGTGVSGGFSAVFALHVYNDGTGDALYAGGNFTSAGGVSADSIARWSGSSWSALGGGVNGSVHALTVWNDGAGAKLVAGGDFTSAGGAAASRLAKWSGAGWAQLGGGISGDTGMHGTHPLQVLALGVFDDGAGPALFVGGWFNNAGTTYVARLGRFDGANWTRLVYGVDDTVRALHGFPSGTGAELYVGGDFESASYAGLNHVGRWNGVRWTSAGSGVSAPIADVEAFDDGAGGGESLFACGDFLGAGGAVAQRVAKWNGTSWTSLQYGITDGVTRKLHACDVAGTGPALYVIGSFQLASGIPANSIAGWNGTTWFKLSQGFNTLAPAQFPLCLTDFDDGTGNALFVGGDFMWVDSVLCRNIAKWNGLGWLPIGAVSGPVRALKVFDDGSGPALYLGGNFTTVAGVAVTNIAKWDGANFFPLGAGVNGTVRELDVFDDGTGPALYAGGDFSTAGGVPASFIAKWDGASWSALGSGVNGTVTVLESFDDGSGPALYVGGELTLAGGTAVSSIAKWDGASWTALGMGIDGAVSGMTPYDGGTGEALFVGGSFRSAPSGDSHLAKWGCASPLLGTPFCSGDGSLPVACPCGNVAAPGHGCGNSVNGAGALLNAIGSTFPDTARLLGTGMPGNSAAIYLKGNVDNSTGVVFGDGVRCADGALIRLRATQNTGGASQFPDSSDTVTLSVRGGTPAGSGFTGYYQVYYRNAAASFCPPATFNVSNGVAILW